MWLTSGNPYCGSTAAVVSCDEEVTIRETTELNQMFLCMAFPLFFLNLKFELKRMCLYYLVNKKSQIALFHFCSNHVSKNSSLWLKEGENKSSNFTFVEFVSKIQKKTYFILRSSFYSKSKSGDVTRYRLTYICTAVYTNKHMPGTMHC